MSRTSQHRKRLVLLLVFAAVASALVVPFFGGAGAAPVLSAPTVLPGDLGFFPPAGAQEQARIARGSDTYLAVWTDSRTALNSGALLMQGGVGAGSMKDIYAARVAADGQVIDQTPIIIDQSGFNQTRPAVGWNGQNWLVVWLAEKPGEFFVKQELRAARVSPAGQVLDQTPIVLDPEGKAEWPYTVIDDGAGNWVVMWTGFLPQEGTSIPRGVIVTKVAPDGTVAAAPRVIYNHHSQFMADAKMARAGDRYLLTFINMGPPYVLVGLPFDQNFVPLREEPETLSPNATGYDLASDGASSWFVSWKDGASGNVQRVSGARVNFDGDPVDVGGISINPSVGVLDGWTRAAWDGQFWFVTYTSDYNPATQTYSLDADLYVSRVSAAGQVQAPAAVPVKVAAGHQYEPAIAPGVGGGVQLAWEDLPALDLRTARVSREAVVTPDAPLALGAPRQYEARAASNGNGFLAVFRSETSTTSRILGQHLDAQGAPVGPEPFVISEGPTHAAPSVGWDGTNYLAVWQASSGGVVKTFARAVPASGAPLAPEFFVMDGDSPDAAGLDGQFLVVNIIQETRQIRKTQAVRVSASGTVLGTPVRIEGVFNFAPRAAAFGGRWLAVWEFHSNHDDAPGTIRGAFVEPSGAVGTPFVVGNLGNDQVPHLAVSGQQALVVWTMGDIRGRRVNADGTSPDPEAGSLISGGAGLQTRPAVAWDGAQYAVAWLDHRRESFPLQPKGDIFAARVAPTGVTLEEFAVADSALPEEQPFVVSGPAPAAGQTGLTVFSYSKFYPEAPYAAHRVTLRTSRLDVPGVGTPPAAPTGLVATQVNEGIGSVTLAWADNSSDETGFKIEQLVNGAWKQVQTVGANQTSLGGLTASVSQAVTFRVRAYNAAGDSDYTNPASPPVANLAQLTPNVRQEPASFQVTANASDAEGVQRVEFYLTDSANYPNYALAFTDTAAPYVWDWANVPAGYYYIRAKAYDTQGSVTTTMSDSVLVQANPRATITSPAGGSVFSPGSTVTVTATASTSNNRSDEWVTRVDLYANNSLVATVSGHYPTYTFNWANVPAGSYELTARPTSNWGLTGTSAPVQIVVGNPGVNISGRVTGAGGAGLYGVRVALSGTQTAAATTDANGDYFFTNVPAGGSYSVTPSASGYAFSPPAASFAALTVSQSANFAGSPGPPVAADPSAAPIYTQPPDGYAVEGPGSRNPAGQQLDGEVADDFDMAARITRVRVRGTRGGYNAPPNPLYYGLFVRFYADDAGKPGALQAEYYLPQGAPGVSFDAAQPSTFDVTLPQPFDASGRHFLSLQPVFGGSEQWWVGSGNRPQVRGAGWHKRDRLSGGPWTSGGVTGYVGDMSYDLFGTLLSSPRIDSVSPSPAERSGIVRISGAHFGATKETGQLRIDGKAPPLVQYWSDDLIIAHVPEDAALGDVQVAVAGPSGTATATLAVTARRSSGRIRWRAELAGDYSFNRVAVAPAGVPGAGTVYAATNAGYLYAFNPDGGIKWIAAGADGDTQTSVGPDGTVYTGTFKRESDGSASPGVAAWDPADGSQRWVFADRGSQSVRAGPNVGPDGKIYVIFRPLTDGTPNNFVGVNFAALRPDGTLAWSVNRGFYRYGQTIAKELVFGRRLPHVYFAFDVQPDPDPSFVNGGFFAYNFDGQLVWQRGNLCCGVPAVAPDEDLRYGGARLSAANGAIVYAFDFPPYGPGGTEGVPDAGPDNVHYTKNSGRVWAINPDGSQKWRYDPVNPGGGFVPLGDPVVNEQNTTILFGGGGSFGQDSLFLAVDPQTGAEQWRQLLPREPGFGEYGNIFFAPRVAYSADGDTGYLTGDVNGDQGFVFQQKYLHLYAVNTAQESVEINDRPSVLMTSPLDGSNHPRGAQVRLAAEATDDQPVAAVEFYAQRGWETPEQLIATDTTAPYTADFQLGDSGTMFVARVRDAGGLVGESRVSVMVANDPPRVTWVSPADGARVDAGSSLTLTVEASDPDGAALREVNFYANGLIGTDTTPDADRRYQVVWQNVPAGTHEVHAQAVDSDGIEGRKIITITAGPAATPTPAPTPTPVPPVGQPPAVTITSPADNTSVPPGTSVTLAADARDPDGTITRVDFYHAPFNIHLGADSNAPYSVQVVAGNPDVKQLYAVATDSSGNKVRSNTVRVIWEDPAGALSISGVIRHQQSDPTNPVFLPNALLELYLHDNLVRTTRTDAQGRYVFDRLSRGGEYGVKPAEPGYTFYPPMVIWSGLADSATRDFVAEGPLPPGPTPTPAPGSSVVEWQKFYNSPYDLADIDPVVAVDAQGNTYVAGTSGATGNSGDTDISTVKYGPDGTQLWARTFVGLGNYKDWATDIAVDGSGNVYVTGTTWRGNAYYYDLVTIKYGPDGAELWVRHHNGPMGFTDMSNALALDPSGGVVVAGYEATRDPFTGKGFDQFVTVKYGADGAVAWVARRTEAQVGDHAIDVAVDPAGNAYVVGFAWTAPGGTQSKDIVTVKYGADGRQLWSARQNGRPGTPGPAPLPNNPVGDEPGGVGLDPAGNVYVFGSNVPGDEQDDFLLLKYSPADGALVWGRNWTGPAYDYARDMAIDSAGNVYLTGSSYDIIFQTVNDYPSSDVATVKFDPAGTLLWERVYRAFPGKDDAGRRIALDAAGNAYVGAYSAGFFNDDTAVIKYLPDGTEAWVFRYDNPNHTGDDLTDMAIDPAGNLYLAGDAVITQASGAKTTDLVTVKLAASAASLNSPPEIELTLLGPTIAGAPAAGGAVGAAAGDRPAPTGPTIAGRSVRLTAQAFDRDGTVVRVSFFRATNDAGANSTTLTLLGTDTSAPFEYMWEDVEPGTYAVTATATDNGGATRTAPTETVTVVAAPATYTIAGRVTSSGSPLSGVTVTLTGSASSSTTTAADGTYSFAGLASGGGYNVTPAMAGRTFTPASRSLSNLSSNQPGQDFAATAESSAAGSDTVWFDDALPGGAAPYANGDTWAWVSSSPAPYSGAKAHQSAAAAGFHNHFFQSATDRLPVGAGDRLFAYVYIDPQSAPTCIVLQWHDGSQWRNAYWGEDRIDWVGARTRVGDIPAPGQWVRLEVPAAALGLEGKSLSGMAFNLWGGKATWDRAGKWSPATPPPPPASGEQVWVEDALPAGAVPHANGETWNWVGASPAPYSGSLAHQSAAAAGFHNHYFVSATQTLSVGAGDVLYTYVYLDPSNVPAELMIQWHDGTTWRNAYWGADDINWVGPRVRMGDVPAAGQWVRLEVPAAALGLEGQTLTGMAFNLWGGRATWDKAGKAPAVAGDTVWVEDALPLAAVEAGNGESWAWVTSGPAPYSGAKAHQSAAASGFHNHFFHSAAATLSVGAGEVLYTYVYIDPANVPAELMLQWHDGSQWRNAYWGEDRIDWVGARTRVGDIPAAGQWVRLEVPAATLGLENRSLTGMAFNLWGGRVTWDKAGKGPHVP